MSLKNARGQIAIFVVLVFQALFILFAMSINIALVVHDKINLQNSLDLATYYGAKKQAEVLNAMAHINYQMRQNWKLLAWRYRILGTLAQYEGDQLGMATQKYWCPQNIKNDDTVRPTSCVPQSTDAQVTRLACQQADFKGKAYGDNYCDYRYFLCIGHNLWKRGISGDGQNLCTKYGINIPEITDLAVVAPFMPEAHLARTGVDKLQSQVNASCPKEGALNWLMTQFFLTHFRLDQKDRKSMLLTIYERTLKEGKDLDGKSIFKGAKKVFLNNLTKDNKAVAQSQTDYGLKEFHSFKDEDFVNIFEPVNVWPILQFVDDSDTNDNDCDVRLNRHFDQGFDYYKNVLSETLQGSGPHSLATHLQATQKALFQFNTLAGFVDNDKSHLDWPIRTLSLGFVKKPDKPLYYGLKAEFKYQSSIFSLSLDPKIQFKASAFAKAFGGRFGPQPAQFDPLIPTHHPDAEIQIPSPSSSGVNPAFLQPNHSRWPGDKWGLIARDLHANESQRTNFLNKHKFYKDTKRVYTMEDFFHLILYEGLADDPLARSPNAAVLPFSFVRMMEMMAVYPDLYDLSYYSISSNYHQTYFPKICKLLKGGSECQTDARNEITGFSSKDDWKSYIRGDFGWPETEEKYIKKNSSAKTVELSIAPYFLTQAPGVEAIIRSEVKNPNIDQSSPGYDAPTHNAQLFGKNHPFTRNPRPPLSQGKIFYPWLAQDLPGSLLSSWVNKIPLNYEKYKDDFPTNRFLKCNGTANENMPVPSACASGGRSGYSVKLISCEVVKDFDLKPSNVNEYCP